MRDVSDEPAHVDRLQAFLSTVDPALLASLKRDERRRRRKIILFSIAGGLVMGSIIAVLCFMFFAPHPAVSAEKADQALSLASDGWQLWQVGKFDQAAEKFHQSVELDPNLANAWNGLGWADLNGGNSKAAEEAFKKCLAVKKDHPAALNGLGQIAFAKRDFAAAERDWLAAAKDAPAANVGLAKLYLLQSKFDQATKYAQAAADSPDADESIQAVLAAAKSGKLDPELKAELEPPAPGADDVVRGWAQLNQGHLNQAIEIFQKAVAADPKNAAALNGLGFALFNLGKPAEAKPQFEKCLALDPKAGGAINGLALCLKSEGKVDEAIARWKTMLDTPPTPNAATAGLAMTYFERKQYDKAKPLLEQLVKADPSNEQWKELLNQSKVTK